MVIISVVVAAARASDKEQASFVEGHSLLLCHAPECKLVAHRKQIHLHFVQPEWAAPRFEIKMHSQKELRADQLDRGDGGRPSFRFRGNRQTTTPPPGRHHKPGEFSCSQSDPSGYHQTAYPPFPHTCKTVRNECRQGAQTHLSQRSCSSVHHVLSKD